MRLFGFSIGRPEDQNQQLQQQPTNKTFALPQNEDGAVTVAGAGYYGTYVDLDGTFRNEAALITKYRELAIQPELETAIDEIVNEAIVHEDSGKSVEINLDDVKVAPNVKKLIEQEFDYILKLLNFGNMGHEIFRRWYIDGRMFYHVVIDEMNPGLGIQEIRYIDPRRIRKIREIKKMRDPQTGIEIIQKQIEYYLYNERGITSGSSNLGAKIAADSIINVNSGIMDPKQTMVLSYLHKAIKPFNNLRMVEDATVIYRLSRAPERRVFYIDVGNMPTVKAEQYVRDIMVKYRNKLVYDSNTGEIKDDRKHLCLSMDTRVPLLDGRTLTLEEISKEYKDKKLWAYSCDPETGKFSPGLITWAGVSRQNAQVMRLTLDNDETIICTPDHRFPVWNQGLVAAKDLQVGSSLIPLYRKMEGITPGAKKNKQYEQIWDNEAKKWVFTHRAVSQWKDSVGLINEFVFNEQFDDIIYQTKTSTAKEQIQHKNHKIKKIEYLTERMDTGCLTIDGNEIFHNNHTFALEAGVYTQNSMLEDFWLPRREGSKGTEISTLEGARNLGELEDVKYFQTKLYKALGVPVSRLEQNNGFSLGRTTEITRDEIKFNKFVVRLRSKFSTLFDDLLRVQLILKNVCNEEEWKEIKEVVWYDFKKDNNFDELKEAELLSMRLDMLAKVDPYVGRYYSQMWVRKNILQQSDDDIEEIDAQMQQENQIVAQQQQQAMLDQQAQQQQDMQNQIQFDAQKQIAQAEVDQEVKKITGPEEEPSQAEHINKNHEAEMLDKKIKLAQVQSGKKRTVAEQAKQLGLTYVGNRQYAGLGGNVTHINENGVLVSVNNK